MKITDLDLREMLGQISDAVSPFVFAGLDATAPAKAWIDRADLQGEVMGRIMAVLMSEEVCSASIGQDVERCAGHMKEQMIHRIRAGIRPGGSLSASMVLDELARNPAAD